MLITDKHCRAALTQTAVWLSLLAWVCHTLGWNQLAVGLLAVPLLLVIIPGLLACAILIWAACAATIRRIV